MSSNYDIEFYCCWDQLGLGFITFGFIKKLLLVCFSFLTFICPNKSVVCASIKNTRLDWGNWKLSIFD